MCSKCGVEPSADGKDNWCKKCRAKYQREYQEGRETRAFSRGVAACMRFLRMDVGSTALTGHQAALKIDKALLSPETNEAQQRRRMVETMRG